MRLVRLDNDAVVDTKTYEGRPSSNEANNIYPNIKLRNAILRDGESLGLTATRTMELGPGLVVGQGASLIASIDPAAATGVAAEEYVYDEIGNLVEDKARGTTIEWTVYGKVKKVSKEDGSSVQFDYDGAGNRVAKTFTPVEGDSKTTWYSRDASGNVMAIYRGEELAEQPIYGSSRLGMYKGGNGSGKRIWTNKQYELTNHLGNVMVVVSDRIIKKDPVTAGPSSPGGPPSPIDLSNHSVFADVLTINDYYPFGLEMPGRSVNFRGYRYGFNGKEKDQAGEFGSLTNYDYGFRIYNPGVGRFLSVDPLTKSYPMLTPYQFASNSPIFAFDLDGLEGTPYSMSPSGQALYGRVYKELGEHFRKPGEVKRYYTTILSLTDIDDVTVLVTTLTRQVFGAYDKKPKSVTGDATGVDQGFAAAGTFLPFISGSALKKALKIGEDLKSAVKVSRDLGEFYRKYDIRKIIITHGDPDKLVIIGQKMDRVKATKLHLYKNAEVFEPSKEAIDHWNNILKNVKDGEVLSEDIIKSTQLYQENIKWISKKVQEGSTIIDIGDTALDGLESIFYKMKKTIVY